MKKILKKTSLYICLLLAFMTPALGLLALVPNHALAACDPPKDLSSCNFNNIPDLSNVCILGQTNCTPGSTSNTNKYGAVNPTTFDSMTSEQQRATVWTELAAINVCNDFNTSLMVNFDYRHPGPINPKITSGKWFSDSDTVSMGRHVDPADGRLNCNNENSWFSSLLDAAGFAGNYSGLYIGMQNQNQLTDALRSSFFPSGQPRTIPNDVYYYILFSAFTTTGNKGCSAVQTPSTPDAQAKYTGTKTINLVGSDGTVTQVSYSYLNNGEQQEVGHNVTGNSHSSWSCDTIANMLSDAKYANAMGDMIKSGKLNSATSTPDSGGSGATGQDPELQCNTVSSKLDWIICPVVKLVNVVLNGLDSAITSLLEVDTKNVDQGTADGARYYTAWKSFRGLAIGILVIAALIMLISQALGFDVFDAYTVKKVMPRLAIAIIAIALSWELMKAFIYFTNTLGFGVRQLIYYPFNGLTQGKINVWAPGALLTLLAGGAILGFGIIGLLLFGVSALFGLLIAFLVLVARQMVILLLIMTAPIAIACYVLPNTQNIWKLWHESFTKALLMFPIIMAFLAVGRVFAEVSATSDNVVNQVIALVAYILPYFLIPTAFRFAGGAMATIGGFANDKSKGVFDRLKKGRQNAWKENGGRRIEAGNRRVLQKRAAWADSLKTRASMVDPKTGKTSRLRRGLYGGLAGSIGGYNVEAAMSHKRAEVSKELNDQIASGRDEEIRALTVNKLTSASRTRDGKRQFQTLGGAWVDEANVDAAHKRWGNDTFAQQTALSYEMRKATTEEELDNLAKNYRNIATGPGGWNMSNGEAAGVWTGAAFENQGTNLSFKKTNWQTGQMSADSQRDFVTEMYEKKATHQIGAMSSYQIKMLEDAYNNGDADTKAKVQAIAESFVTRYGAGGGGAGVEDEALRAAMEQQQQAMAAAQAAGGGAAGVPGVQQVIQTNTPGAAHVAQNVRRLAVLAGNYRDLPPQTNATSITGDPTGTATGGAPIPPNRGPYDGPRLH